MFQYDPKDIPPPKFGKTPLELLSDQTVDPPSLSSAYGWQVGCGFLGSLCQYMTNWVYRRPRWAGKTYCFTFGFFVRPMLNAPISNCLNRLQVFTCIQFILLADIRWAISSINIEWTRLLNATPCTVITWNCIQKTFLHQVMSV